MHANREKQRITDYAKLHFSFSNSIHPWTRRLERVRAAVQKYTDELFIDALKEAPPERVLEPLKALQSTIGANSAEYGDLSSTIQVLEQRKHAADE